MPAPPLVIVQRFSDFMLDPTDATRIVFTISYDIAFVPNENALPQARQDEISLPIAGLSKNVVKAASEARIIAEVAGLGGTIVAGRIFTVADLV
jgi:hypothetical protein